jgi:asparagine synthase (glutamine-hydrolysing)
MCGIAGIFGNKLSKDECKRIIQGMTHAIAHRGPNDEGAVIFGGRTDQPIILSGDDTPVNVHSAHHRYCNFGHTPTFEGAAIAALGHRRLAIIDLSAAGHQPMCTADGRYWITYNGEIYNYIELRKELENSGFIFHTQTDTEVILHSFIHWGIDCLQHFNGMFAFLIYDQQKQRVFAARDRFGVKPLYIWQSAKGFYAYASEIKQFSKIPGWRGVLNHQRAYDFLNWSMTDHTEETLFDGVEQLLGGHYIECHVSEHPQPKRWYSIPHYSIGKTFEEASEAFEELFLDAVNIRLRADVEIGSCLSGGLDSSAIVCAVDHLLDKTSEKIRQQIFSACSEDPRFDEREFVEEVVKGRQLESHYIYPSSEELMQDLQDVVYYQDEPFNSTSIFAQWLIFKHVKKAQVPVMLDGQGADEQLAGYHSFYGYQMVEQFKKLQWISLAKQILSIKKHHPHLSPFLMLGNRLLPPSLRDPLSRILGRSTSKPNWLDGVKLQANRINPLKDVAADDVNTWSHVLMTKSNLPMLLRYEDRNSMAHSIESRTPFLDYRLVELSLNLPTEYKLKGPWTKRILRHSMSSYLPKKITERKDKMAFVTAEEKWMKEQPHHFRHLLQEAVDRSEGIINPSVIESFDQMVTGKAPFSYLPWRIISFGQWMKNNNISLEKGHW